MKKLAYIILVIAILVVVSHFVKQSKMKQLEITGETAVVITENASEDNAAATETNTPAEDHDVVDIQENVEDIIIDDEAPEEDDAVDVEETNPEETTNEDETIVNE